MTYYSTSWMNSVVNLCAEVGVVLPSEDNLIGGWHMRTRKDLCEAVIGDKLKFDYALPQGMVDQYMEDCDYDLRQWFVTAYPEGPGWAVGILFPLTQDALLELNRLHCEAEEMGVEL